MTTEEKFKKLLDKACDNGFDIKTEHIVLFNTALKLNNNPHPYITKDLQVCIAWGDSYSLNDLILQTNFFECLFKGWSLYTEDYSDTLIKLRADYIDANGVFSIGEDSLELSCHKNTVVQFKKFQWVLEVEKGNALEWLFKQFGL